MMLILERNLGTSPVTDVVSRTSDATDPVNCKCHQVLRGLYRISCYREMIHQEIKLHARKSILSAFFRKKLTIIRKMSHGRSHLPLDINIKVSK
jgi:hypothetical protein